MKSTDASYLSETFRVLLCDAYEVSWRARSKEVFRIDALDAAPRVSFITKLWFPRAACKINSSDFSD
jgi:hypothetical protein